MPQFNGRVVSVNNNGAPSWQSQDGQRKIWELMVEVNGRQARCKTYSQQIANVGFSGQFESYEKPNNRGGVDTFIKMAQDPAQAQQGGGGGQQSGGGYSNRQQPQSQYTMYLSYAKDVMCAMIAAGRPVSQSDLLMELQKVAAGGEFLYERRPENPNRPALNTNPVIDDAPVEGNKDELNNVFGNTQPFDDGSDPWNQTPPPENLPF